MAKTPDTVVLGTDQKYSVQLNTPNISFLGGWNDYIIAALPKCNMVINNNEFTNVLDLTTQGLHLKVGAGCGQLTLLNLRQDPNAVIDISALGYKNATDVKSHLVTDGHNGLMLTPSHNGGMTIDLVGITHLQSATAHYLRI